MRQTSATLPAFWAPTPRRYSVRPLVPANAQTPLRSRHAPGFHECAKIQVMVDNAQQGNDVASLGLCMCKPASLLLATASLMSRAIGQGQEIQKTMQTKMGPPVACVLGMPMHFQQKA